MKKYIVLVFISLFGYAQQTPALKQNKSILILGAKAHLGNGTVIENSLVSLVNGKFVIKDGLHNHVGHSLLTVAKHVVYFQSNFLTRS